MMTLDPISEAALGHTTCHIDVARSGHIVAIARKGPSSLLAPDHTTITSFRILHDPTDVAISPDGNLLAITGRDGLLISAPQAVKDLHGAEGSFESCYFSPDGALWCAERLDSDKIGLQIRDTATSQPIARAEFDDPFGDSQCRFYPHPIGNHVAIWVAAGQDGQCLFWAHREGPEIIVDRFKDLDETTPPSFSPDGKQFLVIGNQELRHYVFPHGPLIASMEWPDETGDDAIGDIVSFVDSNRALLTSNENRLFLIDLSEMAIIDEIAIRGHEPRPIGEVYPRLSGQTGLCGDLSFFMRMPDGDFLSVHREFPSVGTDHGHDRLLTWRVADVGNA